MKRREVVQALLTPDAAQSPSPEVPAAPRVASGAVRAMGLEVGRLAEEARSADALRQQIESGTAVLDLPTDRIDPSFVADRFSRTEDTDYRALVESIRETGQQVPILVRPHPTADGRYQIAYGHRRHAAAAELGRPVRAIVRVLHDDELVIAQGQENGERRDLSFIERALFAAELQRRGFGRATLNGALGVHTAEMTRLLAVAAMIPEELIRRIGPAPKAGRQRWQELARECDRPGGQEALAALLDQRSLQVLPSDRRFDAVIAGMRRQGAASPAATPEVNIVTDAQGREIARLEHLPEGLRVTFAERVAPGISAFVARELRHVFARYQAGHR
ncbi:MAG TPA: plasmid partitioning protein RepB [Acetobacteraceae bacterium]|nr:plasmid partitioning protein RepB [Acetobacteraceae bacterium]